MARAAIGSQQTKSLSDEPRYYFMDGPMDHNDALDKIPRLRKELKKALRTCPYEFKVTKVAVLYSKRSKCMTRFLKHGSIDESRFLFSATPIEQIPSIAKRGFDSTQNSNGWYGRGHYFTAFPQHAMLFARQGRIKSGKEITLLASYVSAGKTQAVTQRPKRRNGDWHNGRAIPPEYDSNHVWIDEKSMPVNVDNKGALVYDEWVIRDGSRILPAYSVTFKCISERCVVWRDSRVHSPDIDRLLKILSRDCPVYGVKTSQAGWDLIKYKQKGKGLRIITNGGDDGEGFVRYIRNTIGCDAPILVFCSAVDWHSKWAKKYANVVVTRTQSSIFEWTQKGVI